MLTTSPAAATPRQLAREIGEVRRQMDVMEARLAASTDPRNGKVSTTGSRSVPAGSQHSRPNRPFRTSAASPQFDDQRQPPAEHISSPGRTAAAGRLPGCRRLLQE